VKRISVSERLFDLLPRLYPREFRDAYGEEMARTFRDLLRDARSGDGRCGGRCGVAAPGYAP
jgi:hypothetical protein